MSFLALFIIGPFFHSIEEHVLNATKFILNLPFGLAGLLIGGVHQLIVVTGVHHIFNLLESQLITSDKKDPFNAIITAAMTAQAGATLAVAVKSKSQKVKALAFPATISALLGITEPAIFGVNLRYVKPFVIALGAGAVLKYVFMVVFTTALSFGLTYMFGYEDEASSVRAEDEEAGAIIEEETTGTVPASLQDETIISPIVGQAVALENVNDPVFSSGAMGQGIAVKPSEGVVYAPADAEVTIAFATGHAFGLKTANGAEILIHVGIDTVSMNGDGFEKKVAQGDKVKAGDVLGTFDSAKIAAAGLDDTTMVIVTNTADYASVTPVATGAVAKGDAIIEVKA